MTMMPTMRPPVMLSRTARRYLSTRGPRGPRGLLDKSRTPSRMGRSLKPLPQSNRHQSSQQKDSQQKPNENLQKKQDEDLVQPTEEPSKVASVSTALAENESSDLVTPVRIPDDPDGILRPDHPAWNLLNNSSLVIQRQIEMMNVFLGFEQANKYVIMNGRGETIGYMAEQDHGLGTAMARQAFKTHRSFTSHIFDKDEREILRIHRPFAWINSRIRIYDPCTSSSSPSDSLQDTVPQVSAAQISSTPLSEMRIIGEAQQQWAPLRRKYNLFSYRPLTPTPTSDTPTLTSGDTPNADTKALTLSSVPEQAIEAGMTQFAHVNEPFLSWDFTLKNADDTTIGSVNRNFVGFARELFTDTGVYALRMDSASLASSESTAEETAMTLDQRAVMLATAVSIDFDYFSRHSGAGGVGGFMPLWFPGMGGGAAEGGAVGGAVGGAAGEVGAIEGAGTAVGGAARGVAGTEGAIAGAGTMAGYEAMRQGRGQQQDDASPTVNEPFNEGATPQEQQSVGEQAWGEQQDPWGEQQQDPWNQGDSQGGSTGGDAGGSSGGDGGGIDWGDFF